MKKYLVTSALPYINGTKHLGNLIGSLLPADAYTRFLRQQGEEVLFICGTDEHGTPAEIAAQQAQMTTQSYCDMMYEKQKEIFHEFNISFDYFGRSSSHSNHLLTQEIFNALDKNGYIKEKVIEQIYSLDDNRFLPDRYVSGECPHCHYQHARGDQCEHCGKLLNPNELINPYSTLTGSTNVEIRSSHHIFLDLSALQNKVADWVSTCSWSPLVEGIATKWLKEGLKERCISRDLEWGVKIPKRGYENKVFYVWFDAPIAYISMTKDWAESTPGSDKEQWKSWWMADHDKTTEYVQFMAKDNVPFHAIFFPAMLLGASLNYKLVDTIKGFNWLTYEKGKFSTSQGRGVFSDQALALFPADYWRYYLFSAIPESTDSDFTFEHFASIVNKDLADVLGNFVNRTFALLKKYFDFKIPETSENNMVDDLKLQEDCRTLVNTYEQDLRNLKFRSAMNALRSLMTLGNEYITRQEPWKIVKLDSKRSGVILYNCLETIALIAVVAHSIIPEISKRLFKSLNIDLLPENIAFKDAQKFNLLRSGNSLGAEEFLVKKITKEEIEALTVKFSGKMI